jgi:hypothetical protein
MRRFWKPPQGEVDGRQAARVGKALTAHPADKIFRSWLGHQLALMVQQALEPVVLD